MPWTFEDTAAGAGASRSMLKKLNTFLLLIMEGVFYCNNCSVPCHDGERSGRFDPPAVQLSVTIQHVCHGSARCHHIILLEYSGPHVMMTIVILD